MAIDTFSSSSSKYRYFALNRVKIEIIDYSSQVEERSAFMLCGTSVTYVTYVICLEGFGKLEVIDERFPNLYAL